MDSLTREDMAPALNTTMESDAPKAAPANPVSEEESAVFRRGRNAKVHGVPAHASVAQYHTATGLEALFGWLYLLGRTERISELFQAAMEG